VTILFQLYIYLGKGEATHLFGTKVGPELSGEDKIWRVLSALGNIALACSYATVVYDIMVRTQNLVRLILLIRKKK
jgi:hypothetical protein